MWGNKERKEKKQRNGSRWNCVWCKPNKSDKAQKKAIPVFQDASYIARLNIVMPLKEMQKRDMMKRKHEYKYDARCPPV